MTTLHARCFIALAALFATALSAQTPTSSGQYAERGLSVWASHNVHPKMDALRANDEFDRIGYRDINDSLMPSQTMEVFYATIGVDLPTGNLTNIGVRFLPLYEDSPSSAFDDFGAEFNAPLALDPTLNPGDVRRQWQHIEPRIMFQAFPTYGPYSVTDWLTHGIPTGLGPTPATSFPLVGNIAGGGFLPTVAFSALEPIADVPATSPTGGKLIGLNAVLQATVLDTNASTPTAPKLRLSNAIGLRCMAGPPIKIGLDGGNYGGRGGSIRLVGDYISPTITAGVTLSGGGVARLATDQIDGQTFDVILGPNASSGVMSFGSATGPGQTVDNTEAIVVLTHGPVHDAALDSFPPIHIEMEDGELVYGFSLVGTADQIGEVVNLIPPAILSLFDLDVEVFPYDDVDDVAGYGNGVGVSVDVTSIAPATNGTVAPLGAVGTTMPAMEVPAQPAIVEPIGASGSVLRVGYEDLAGDYEINFNTAMPNSTVRYLATIRARAAN